MTPEAIEIALVVCLIAGFAVGLPLMVWWMMKVVYVRNKRAMEARGGIDLHAVAMRTFVLGLPGCLAFAVCMVPALYFGHLSKQVDYCRELVRVNDLKRDDAILAERCGGIDVDALFALP